MSIIDPPQLPRPVLRRVFADPTDYLDDLLVYIDEGRVVPIIGPELLQVQDDDGQTVALYDFIARQLAQQFGVTDLPAGFTLQDVAAAYSRSGGDMGRLYTRILRILQGRSFSTPPALLALAGIDRFQLFITTTFDPLLTQALAQVRGEAPRQVVYTGTRVRGDLEKGWDNGPAPTVFHLMGQATGVPNYVVTEEDSLEFLTKLQADAPQMKLFEELTDKHLLILGCSFPDWMTRFFIRMTKGMQLSTRRSAMEWLADSRSGDDGTLALFLDNFSANTRVFTVSALDFVEQLAARWQARPGARVPGAAPSVPANPGGGEMPSGALLISYQREDQAAAERLRDGLRTVTDVWMDLHQLEAGDAWDPHIHRAVRECTLFFPVISRRAAQEDEGYFRREWKAAVKRLDGMSEERPFVIPVVVDDLEFGATGVPGAFWDAQATSLPGGRTDERFLDQVKKKVMRVRQPARA